MKKSLKFKQLVPCQWKDTYSIVGLTQDGEVYVYDRNKAGWVKYGMDQIDSFEQAP